MSVLEMIRALEKAGNKVSYYQRKDGGYVITKINNTRFSGKSGNVRARQILGQKLSYARQVQLARIRVPKGQRQVKRTAVPEYLKKRLRKIQVQWRKDHPDIRGTISMRGLRYTLEHFGEEAAEMSLDKAWRYSQGYAYFENVQFLIERIRMNLYKQPSSEMERVVSLIEQRMNVFKEEWIQHCYEAIYDWERHIIDGAECARRIESIIVS